MVPACCSMLWSTPRLPTIVFSSSCAIYGEPDSTPIGEGTPTRPINPYGFTKLVCECMMDDFGRAHGLKSARLRYFNAAGSEPTGEIGEDHEPNDLVPLILDAALGRRPSVQVFGTDYRTPDGTAIRDYVHVTDLARAHVLALQYLLGGGDTLAINLASGRGASVREVIDVASAVTDRKITGMRGAASARGSVHPGGGRRASPQAAWMGLPSARTFRRSSRTLGIGIGSGFVS